MKRQTPELGFKLPATLGYLTVADGSVRAEIHAL